MKLPAKALEQGAKYFSTKSKRKKKELTAFELLALKPNVYVAGGVGMVGQIEGEWQCISVDLLCWLSGKKQTNQKTKSLLEQSPDPPLPPEAAPGEMLTCPITQRHRFVAKSQFSHRMQIPSSP